MQRTRLLLLDDDRWLLESMAGWLAEQGFVVTTASTVAQARQRLKSDVFDVCLVDVILEGEEGFALLNWCKQNHPELPVIMMTGYAGPDAGAEAVAAGAFDLLTKPIIDQELLTTVRRAVDQTRIAEENREISERGRHEGDGHTGQYETIGARAGEARHGDNRERRSQGAAEGKERYGDQTEDKAGMEKSDNRT